MEPTDEELLEALQALEEAEREEDLCFPPEEEPAPVCWDPSLHDDQGPIQGYSTFPRESELVRLSRENYATLGDAEVKFEEMRQVHKWSVYGQPFWTARFWCWRVTWSGE